MARAISWCPLYIWVYFVMPYVGNAWKRLSMRDGTSRNKIIVPRLSWLLKRSSFVNADCTFAASFASKIIWTPLRAIIDCLNKWDFACWSTWLSRLPSKPARARVHESQHDAPRGYFWRCFSGPSASSDQINIVDSHRKSVRVVVVMWPCGSCDVSGVMWCEWSMIDLSIHAQEIRWEQSPYNSSDSPGFI
jgi:hypothetical protein